MDVLDILRRDGVFQPDFSKSRYLSVNPPLAELYDFVLRCYNQVNGTRLPGLVFAFAWSDNESVYLFGSSQEFYRYMLLVQDVVRRLLQLFQFRCQRHNNQRRPEEAAAVVLDIDHRANAALNMAAMLTEVRQINVAAPVAPITSKHVIRLLKVSCM